MPEKKARFKETLDECHEWPCPYVFKFIVPSENLQLIKDFFPENEVKTKKSKTGKYTSVTAEVHAYSSKEVMDIYEKVSIVPGIMSL